MPTNLFLWKYALFFVAKGKRKGNTDLVRSLRM